MVELSRCSKQAKNVLVFMLLCSCAYCHTYVISYCMSVFVGFMLASLTKVCFSVPVSSEVDYVVFEDRFA